jgi:LPS-assembly lipoprotein
MALALVGAVALGGCSYRPLYGSTTDDAGVAATLSSITIPEAESRVGQIIRNDLISGMQPSGQERYTLLLTPEYKTSRVIGKVQPAVTREQVQIALSYQLIERQTGAAVTSGKTFAQASFDVVRQPVADMQAETDATERAAREVAADVRTRLAAFFATRQ